MPSERVGFGRNSMADQPPSDRSLEHPGGDVLVARDILVELNGTRILNGASLTVAEGEAHVLIGPNGAGKTTLANVLTGHVRPVSGTVELLGHPLTGRPWRRVRQGVGRKFQVPRIFHRLTAAQNLTVAHKRSGLGDLAHAGIISLDEVRDVKGEALSHGWRQWLEMGMVLSQGPKVTVLDEPTAGMPKREREEFARLIAEKRGKLTYLIVEHDMDFVAAAADIVSFMHDGRIVVTGSFDTVRSHPLVRNIYLGESGFHDAGSIGDADRAASAEWNAQAGTLGSVDTSS
jgi:urea transport system ATP-binding protein